MFGIDISSYQEKIDLANGANYDFAIIKATEGYGFKDRCFNRFAVQLTELDKLIGCYHFARPDLNGTVEAMQKEADWFVSVVEVAGLIGKALLVLDWETEPINRPDLISAWIERVAAQTGVKPLLYSSKANLFTLSKSEIYNKVGKWVAVWPSINRLPVGENPGFTSYPRTVNWVIWQYSSTGQYPKFPGNVDLNYANMSPKEWLAIAGDKSGQNPVSEHISEDMQWAIDEGLFIGYGNGKYGPKDTLTREQAASLMKRLYEKLK